MPVYKVGTAELRWFAGLVWCITEPTASKKATKKSIANFNTSMHISSFCISIFINTLLFSTLFFKN